MKIRAPGFPHLAAMDEMAKGHMLMQKGFELYKQMQDKSWGLVDCISIVVARNMSICEIFTTNHHFEPAGFEILLETNI